MGYRGKTREREEARALRAAGLTMPAIAERLGVSRSSVSLWTRDVPVDPAARRSRAGPRRREPNALQRRKAAEIERLQAEGRARIGRLSDREFLVAGAALYAGEGAKGDGRVVFANSDPRLVAFHCAWLRRFFTVDEARLRGRIYLHRGLDIDAATAFWSSVTGIPPTQFGAPHRPEPDPSIRSAKHVHGCAYVSYACATTHRAVMGLMSALLEGATLPG
jgi:predicted transcriptional regulator